MASIVTFAFGLRAEQKQNSATRLQNARGLLVQLRGGYARISTLLEQGQSAELETALTTSSGLLRTLSQQASGGDYSFLASAYREDSYPEESVSLYHEALARLTEPILRITALRGLADAETRLANSKAANDAMAEALDVNEKANYPRISKLATENNTARVWVTLVNAPFHECAAAKQHAEYFITSARELGRSVFSPSSNQTKEVKEGSKTACE